AFLTLVLAVILWVEVTRRGADAMQFEELYPWIPAFHVSFHVGVDGLNAPLVLLTTLMTTLGLFYSARVIEERVKEYYLLFLLLEMGLCGVLLSLNLVQFYIFWGLGMVPMFLIIGVWGGERREHAAIKYSIYTLLGNMALLLAILSVYVQTGTFEIADAAAARPFHGVEQWAWACLTFGGLFVGLAVNMACFPFHSWLPDAHTEAPTAGSVIMAGMLLKLGGYGLIRVALPLFPQVFRHFVVNVPIIPILAVISIVYGALVCLAQWDLKRLVAYSSVAHMGYVTLGVCAAAASYGMLSDQETLNLATTGLSGAAMQMFTHGIITGGLFFLVGILHERTHSYDLKAFGGLANRIPYYYGVTLVTCLASLGLPGLCGFWGEFFVFRGTMHFIPLYAFIGVLGLVFTAVYMLWKVVQHLFLGRLDKRKWGRLQDMTWWEKVTLWPLVLVMVGFGFYPTPILELFNTAAKTLLEGLP
ncbi:MAG: NADH-quinone oxidoreductase subunit M, partial [Chloroflexota bacterium]|nr:NADH-quinone oxidoreductase subunit M [Chloroflexota bacterium]